MVLTFIRSLVFKSNSLRPWDIAFHREWEFLEDHSHSIKYLRGGQGSQDYDWSLVLLDEKSTM